MIKHEGSELSDRSFGIIKGIFSALKGMIGGYVILVICFTILAAVYTYTPFPARLITHFVTGITAVSMLFCGIITSRYITCFGWLHGAVSGFMYSTVRCLAGALILTGFKLGIAAISTLALGMLLGAIGGILGINLKK